MLNDSSPATVTLDLTATLVSANGDHVPVLAALRYDLADPYAIRATFTTPANPRVTWVFARELLTKGIRGAAGVGDVRVWRASLDGQVDVYIGLLSSEGEALLHFSGAELSAFLGRTYQQCRPGDEHVHLDLDDAIEQLLAS